MTKMKKLTRTQARSLKKRIMAQMHLSEMAEKLHISYQALCHKLGGFAPLWETDALRIEAVLEMEAKK